MIIFKKFIEQKENFINESTKKQMETHLSHIEDLAIEQGKEGFFKFVEIVNSIVNKLNGLESQIEINAKIDGSPALLFGIDPRNDQFFISTKHVVDSLLTVIPPDAPLLHSEAEIDMYYGDRPSFAEKLKILFSELNKAYDKSGLIYQCDALYAGERDKRLTNIDGEDYITFKPNVIVYAVLADQLSPLYSKIQNSSVGIAVHDSYTTKLITDKSMLTSLKRAIKNNKNNTAYKKKLESFSNKSGKFIKLIQYSRKTKRIIESGKSSNVFVIGSNFSQAKVNIDSKITIKLNDLISKSFNDVNNINENFNSQYVNSQMMEYLKIFINSQIDQPDGGIFGKTSSSSKSINDFIFKFEKFLENRYNVKISKLKQEKAIKSNQLKLLNLLNFINQNIDSFKALISLLINMIAIKKILLPMVEKLSHSLNRVFFEDPSGALIPTKGEGHVIFNKENQVKIVDRLEFTKVNRQRGGIAA